MKNRSRNGYLDYYKNNLDDIVYFDYRNRERGLRTKDWMLFVAGGGLSDIQAPTQNEEIALNPVE